MMRHHDHGHTGFFLQITDKGAAFVWSLDVSVDAEQLGRSRWWHGRRRQYQIYSSVKYQRELETRIALTPDTPTSERPEH